MDYDFGSIKRNDYMLRFHYDGWSNWWSYVGIAPMIGAPQRGKEESIHGKVEKGTATEAQEVYLLDRLSRVAKLQL